MTLKLPKGAEAAFRIDTTAGPEGRFGVHVYGAGRSGWCVASYRAFGRDLDTGVRPLPTGEWLTLLHLIERCGFWSLPPDGAHLIDPDVAVDDGERLVIAGRDAARYHRVNRWVRWEPGLNGVLAFGRRVSGFFARHPVSGRWVPPAALPPPEALPAEPVAVPAPDA